MIEEILQEILQEQKRTNYLLENMSFENIKSPNELLTIEQVKEETGFGIGTVQKMFRDPNFKAQRYTTPFKVTRKTLYEYINESHDYLSDK